MGFFLLPSCYQSPQDAVERSISSCLCCLYSLLAHQEVARIWFPSWVVVAANSLRSSQQFRILFWDLPFQEQPHKMHREHRMTGSEPHINGCILYMRWKRLNIEWDNLSFSAMMVNYDLFQRINLANHFGCVCTPCDLTFSFGMSSNFYLIYSKGFE